MPHLVYGLEVWPLLNDDETPLETVGCLKFLDANGNTNFQIFRTNSLGTPEAFGMVKMQQLAVVDELDTEMYMSMGAEGVDDDDE